MAGPKYRPGEAAGSLKNMTREAVLATRGLSDAAVAARATAKALASLVGPAVAAANARAAKAQAETAASAGKLATEFDRAADRLSRFHLPKLDLGKALGTVLAGVATDKVVGKAAIPTGVGVAKAGIDMGANKAASLSIGVSHAFLKSQLRVAHFTVATAVKGMAAVAFLPITVATIGLKVGLGIAQALVYAKVKQMTGWSHIKMLIAYGTLRVGLAISTRTVKAAVSAMARIAVIPIRVTTRALKSGLSSAAGLVKNAVSSMASLAAAGPGGLGMAGLLGGVAGLGAAGAAIFTAVKGASDLEEVSSKVGFTFGKSAGIVRKGADDMAGRFGVVKQDFLEGASAIGLIGKASGLADDAAATLGVNVSKLAGDLASFHNIGVDDALEKLRSGLVGESEPLRTLGVLLNETAVKAQAAKMGFREVAGALSEGAKVQARAALIFEQTKSAQGDLARTADSLANRVRELWGRMQNLAATLGQYLLPAAKTLSGVFAEMAKGVAERIEKSKATFEGWAKSIDRAAGMVGVLYRNWQDFTKAGGIIMKDVGANLWEGIRVAFANAVNYAKYFANVAGQAIEKAIQNALHNSLSSSNWTAKFAPEAYQQRVSYTPPEVQKPKFGMSPEVKDVLGGVKTFETFRALTAEALKLQAPMQDLAGRVWPMLAAKAKEMGKPVAPMSMQDAQRGTASIGIALKDALLSPLKYLPQSAAQKAKDFRDALTLAIPDVAGIAGALGGPVAGLTQAALGAETRRGVLTRPKPAGKELPKPGSPESIAGGLSAQLSAALGGAAGFGIGGVGALAAGASNGLATAAALKAKADQPKLAGLAEKGSQDAYSAIARHQSGGGKDKPAMDTAKNTAALLVETKRTNRLIDALGGQKLSAYSF